MNKTKFLLAVIVIVTLMACGHHGSTTTEVNDSTQIQSDSIMIDSTVINIDTTKYMYP